MSEYICTHLELDPMAEDPTICVTTVQEIKETQNRLRYQRYQHPTLFRLVHDFTNLLSRVRLRW